MRSLIIGAISILALASVHGAFAQTAQNSARPPATANTNMQEQHPDWYKSKGIYRPCPASVTFSKRAECLPWLPIAVLVSLLKLAQHSGQLEGGQLSRFGAGVVSGEVLCVV